MIDIRKPLRALRGPAVAVALSAGIVGACGIAANAQSDSKPFTIKVGVFSPSDSYTRDFSGNSHAEVGVTYDIKKPDSTSPFAYGVYFDYIGSSSQNYFGYTYYDPYNYTNADTFSGTGSTSAYGGGFQVRYLLSQYDSGGGRHHGGGFTPYIGAGIGFYDSFAKDVGYDQDYGNYYYSHSEGGLGGKLSLGIQSRSGFLGEVSYQWLPDNQGIKMSGAGASIGYRF